LLGSQVGHGAIGAIGGAIVANMLGGDKKEYVLAQIPLSFSY
jgi:hypothetical protein